MPVRQRDRPLQHSCTIRFEIWHGSECDELIKRAIAVLLIQITSAHFGAQRVRNFQMEVGRYNHVG